MHSWHMFVNKFRMCSAPTNEWSKHLKHYCSGYTTFVDTIPLHYTSRCQHIIMCHCQALISYNKTICCHDTFCCYKPILYAHYLCEGVQHKRSSRAWMVISLFIFFESLKCSYLTRCNISLYINQKPTLPFLKSFIPWGPSSIMVCTVSFLPKYINKVIYISTRKNHNPLKPSSIMIYIIYFLPKYMNKLIYISTRQNIDPLGPTHALIWIQNQRTIVT